MLNFISNLMAILCVLCYLAIHALLIIFIICWVMKKKKLWIGLSILFCFIGIFIFGIIFGITNYASMTPEEQLQKAAELEGKLEQEEYTAEHTEKDQKENAESSDVSEPDTVNTNPETVIEKVDMVTQFKELGFTDSEAVNMKEIFTTVGITEINNIQYALGNGIDNLQSFKCDIYDYRADRGGISLHFTIDQRQLCFISLDGIPTTKTDYAYINLFGNIKYKTSNSLMSVTLYDVWDENGEIIPDAIGYKAVFNYKEHKITEYK